MKKKSFIVLEVLVFFLINLTFSFADSEVIINPDTNHSYQVISSEMTWTQAYNHCMNSGGHLATLTSSSENDYVYNKLVKPINHYCWLGGTDIKTEGDWRWITGETWKYTNWASGEPNNYCANEQYLHTYKGKSNAWNDQVDDGRCANYGLMYPLCEWSASDEYYSLTVVTIGNGKGSIISNPVGISCGTNCQKEFIKNAEVKLFAKADEGSVFLGWSDNKCNENEDCLVVTDRDIIIEATFVNADCDYTDSDGDGVIDIFDADLNTPKGSAVYSDGRISEDLYNEIEKLKQTISEMFTEEQLQGKLQSILDCCDIDGNGKISLAEIINGLETLAGVKNNSRN